MSTWHVWSLNSQKYKYVVDFLSEMDEIEDYFYPLVEKSVNKNKVKEVPLYSNYIFIKYEHDNSILNKLLNSPYLYTYVGECDEREIERINKLTKKAYDEIILDNKLHVGEYYRLKSTPFKGMLCRVVDVDCDRVVVAVELFGAERLIKCLVDDIVFERD